MKKHFCLLALLLLCAACAINIATPKTVPEAAIAPEKAWENVLARFVDEKGRIEFAGAAKNPSDLEAYVAQIARVSPASSPSSFPKPEAKLAYYINAYNALALYNAVRSGIPPELESIKIRFFYRTKFEIGGKRMSLYDLENKVIRPMGDPRVHFALNCMVRGCPRLPREPFHADPLDAELEAVAQYFFNEERNVKLEPDKQVVRFSQILQFYTEDFLKKAPSLVDYANRYRQEKIGAGWKVDFIPYDWTLNKQ